MDRLCAKPTCALDAVAWLEVQRQSRSVVERPARSEVTMGLCEKHRSRFGVPAGWRFDTMEGTAEASARPLLPGMTRNHQDSVAGPTAGSLLHRAFHGPSEEDADEACDQPQTELGADEAVSSADVTDADELGNRRAARAVDPYGTAQLPFPPTESDVRRAAVS